MLLDRVLQRKAGLKLTVIPAEKNRYLISSTFHCMDKQLFHVSEHSLSLGLFEKREPTRYCSVAPSRLSQPAFGIRHYMLLPLLNMRFSLFERLTARICVC